MGHNPYEDIEAEELVRDQAKAQKIMETLDPYETRCLVEKILHTLSGSQQNQYTWQLIDDLKKAFEL